MSTVSGRSVHNMYMSAMSVLAQHSRRPHPHADYPPRYPWRLRRKVLQGLAAIGALVAVVAVTAGTAAARPSTTLLPSGYTAYAVAVAVRDSPLTSEVPDTQYTVEEIRLASSDPAWALVEIRPVSDTVGPAVGVVRQTAAGWHLAQLGSYEVGCGVAPADVLVDFELTCPPAELRLLPA